MPLSLFGLPGKNRQGVKRISVDAVIDAVYDFKPVSADWRVFLPCLYPKGVESGFPPAPASF